MTVAVASITEEQQAEALLIAEQAIGNCDPSLRMTMIQWDLVRDHLLLPLAARIVAAEAKHD